MIKGLPSRIKELRVMQGYSQRQVAEKLHVSPSIVSGYETGERTPSTEILLALSYLFKCSTDYLLGKTSSVSALIDAEGLTPEQYCAVVTLVDTMRRK